jgi:hypothetical protein
MLCRSVAMPFHNLELAIDLIGEEHAAMYILINEK